MDEDEEVTPGMLDYYWSESKRPLTSFVFIAPMLLLYEGGLLLLGHEAARNGVDVWLRNFLQVTGFTQYFLLPLLTGGILLAWHHLSRHPWRIDWRVLLIMLVETIFLGFFLLLFAQFLGGLFARLPQVEASITFREAGQKIVGPLGAGIYEELFFRLMLLPVLVAIVTAFKQPRIRAQAIGVVATSLLFSAAHFQIFTGYGDAFGWYSFTFRFFAGVFFAVLFINRGFGVAAGSHALYDAFVTVHFLMRSEG